jgi:hypothetical protein
MPDVKIPSKNPNMDFTVVTAKVEKPDLREKEKPLVDLKVTNPITYIKSWWKKIIGNDGIEIKIKVKPLTTIAIAIIVVTVTLGIGSFRFPFAIPFFEYGVNATPTPFTLQVNNNSNPTTRDTAFSGVLQYDTVKGKFFLMTVNSEAISLSVPENLDMKNFVGRRIFAVGSYRENDRLLMVESASDMEILPTNAVIIPTETSTPTSSYVTAD